MNLMRTDCMNKYLNEPPYRFLTYETLDKQFSCLNILAHHNDSTRWKSFINKFPSEKTATKDAEYLELTKNCQKFKTSRGFVLTPLSEISKHFAIAFNIIAHTSANQIELLLRALYRPQNSICIHVDFKAPEMFKKAVESMTKCFDNVFLSSKSESVTWGGFSRLQADITCMKDHLQRNESWKYLINTAGQAFPIRTIEEMVQILKIYNGANDIEGLYGRRLVKNRYKVEWHENTKTHTMLKTGKNNTKPPHDIDIVRGSAYGIFSRKFVEFIINDKKAIDFLEWSKKTWSPDELFWATLHHTYSNPHLKTPGGFSGYPMDKKWLAVYANWGEKPCHGKFVRSVCVLGVEDLSELISRKEFFLNKLYIDYQPLALQCLAAWIRFKEMCSVPFDDSFYKTLNFIRKPNS